MTHPAPLDLAALRGLLEKAPAADWGPCFVIALFVLLAFVMGLELGAAGQRYHDRKKARLAGNGEAR